MRIRLLRHFKRYGKESNLLTLLRELQDITDELGDNRIYRKRIRFIFVPMGRKKSEDTQQYRCTPMVILWYSYGKWKHHILKWSYPTHTSEKTINKKKRKNFFEKID